jgi:hypothetical protein
LNPILSDPRLPSAIQADKDAVISKNIHRNEAQQQEQQ